jgi:hypothetical protein
VLIVPEIRASRLPSRSRSTHDAVEQRQDLETTIGVDMYKFNIDLNKGDNNRGGIYRDGAEEENSLYANIRGVT